MEFMANLALPKRIGLLVFLSLALGLGLFSLMGVQSLNDSTQRTLEERLTMSRIVASHLDETVYHSLIHLRDAAASRGSLPTEPEFREEARVLINTAKQTGIFSQGIFLIDSHGKVLQQLYQFDAEGQVLPGYGDVESLVASGKAAWSSLVNAPATTNPVVFAVAPIRDPGGRYIGALSMAVDVKMSSIGGFIKPITLGNTGYVEIVDMNGVVLARTEPGRPPQAFEMSDHPGRFAQLMAEGKATVRTCHRCHGAENQIERRKDVLAFAPLSFAPWGVAIRQSEEEAFAIADQLKKRLLLLGGIIVVSMFLVVWIFMQGVMRPLRMLTSAAARVATGDFRAVMPIWRRDEIGQLSGAFASMTRDLEKTHSELVSRNQELLTLNSIAATVSLSLDLEEILNRATRKVLEITGSDVGCVFLKDAKKEEFKLASCVGNSNLFGCQEATSHTANCACHQVLQFGHALLVNDTSQCPVLARESASKKGSTGFVSVPLKSKDKVLGVMNVTYSAERCFTYSDFELMHSIGYHVGLAVENSLLYQEARNKEELRGQLLSAIINAEEEERKRISRELHDGCAQTLTGLIMKIESAESTLSPRLPAVADRLASARLIAVRVLDEMRKIMRGLRSTDLDELGLVAAIRSNAKTLLEAVDIRLDFEAQGFNRSLPIPTETALFRIVQEAVHNIIKHSGAHYATIRMRMERDKIVAAIGDDGRGFDAASPLAPGKGVQSLGLVGMQERAALLAGTLSVSSTPGHGTLIVVEIPTHTPSQGKETADGQQNKGTDR